MIAQTRCQPPDPPCSIAEMMADLADSGMPHAVDDMAARISLGSEPGGLHVMGGSHRERVAALWRWMRQEQVLRG